MKNFFTIALMLTTLAVAAQTEEAKVTAAMKEFHQALISQDKTKINKITDDAVSFGHSNGWIQNKTELVNDFVNVPMTYHTYKEDSIQVSMGDGVANVRFIADITATMRGGPSNNHLKVLEVWVRKKGQWVLFARQAVK